MWEQRVSAVHKVYKEELVVLVKPDDAAVLENLAHKVQLVYLAIEVPRDHVVSQVVMEAKD
jgi:hypothetical protein